MELEVKAAVKLAKKKWKSSGGRVEWSLWGDGAFIIDDGAVTLDVVMVFT